MLEYSSDESVDQDQRIGKNQLSKSDDQGEAILLEMEENSRQNVSFSFLIVHLIDHSSGISREEIIGY